MEYKYNYRSLHLDCARHFFSLETVKKVIEGISYGNLNVLHWHLTDDHAWRIESKKFPSLHEKSGQFYTQKEIREIIDFAKKRGIEVVPEIDMPGHNLALLSVFPEYSCKGVSVAPAKARGVYKTILCAGKEDTYSFVEELLEEMIPLFDSEYFHIGGDEAPKDEWKECPHCNARMKELGLGCYEDLQGWFTAQICDVVKKYGKKPIVWNDALLARNLPDDIVVQYWTIDYAKEMKNFVEKGGKWIYSDMFELYLDYPHSMIPLKKVYEFEPHLYKYEIPVVRREKGSEGWSDANSENDEHGLLGYECCCWTEHIETEQQLYEHIFPRVYALAERAAGERHTDYESFKRRVREKVKLLETAGIPYTKEEWWDPNGKARRDDAINFYLNMGADVDEVEKKKQATSAAPKIEFVLHFIKEFYRIGDVPTFLKKLLLDK